MSKIDLRDLHVYGGGLTVATGLGLYHIGAGLVSFGLLMVYLGLRGA